MLLNEFRFCRHLFLLLFASIKSFANKGTVTPLMHVTYTFIHVYMQCLYKEEEIKKKGGAVDNLARQMKISKMRPVS